MYDSRNCHPIYVRHGLQCFTDRHNFVVDRVRLFTNVVSANVNDDFTGLVFLDQTNGMGVDVIHLDSRFGKTFYLFGSAQSGATNVLNHRVPDDKYIGLRCGITVVLVSVFFPVLA